LAWSPFIEIEALGAEAVGLVGGSPDEDLVRLNWIDQPLRRCPGQRLRCGIGGTGILQPQVTVEHRQYLRGEEASLGEQMAGALAANRDLIGKFGPEQDQCFSIHPAILDEAEAHRVDPRAPGQVREGFATARDRIGDPGAVEMECEPALLREFAQGRDLGSTIGEPVLGRVRDRERRWLDLMHVVADEAASRGYDIGADLRAGPVEQDQLCTAGVEAGPTRLIYFDMSVSVAENAAVWRAQCCQGQAIGSCAGRRPEGANLGPKDV